MLSATLRPSLVLAIALPLACPLSLGAAEDVRRGAIVDRNSEPLAVTKANGDRHYPLGEDAAHLTGYLNESKGVSGLEKSFEEQLRKGATPLRLTIDAELQMMTTALLRENKTPGAVVIQDSTNGDLLALVSWPSYDPNIFARGITHKELITLHRDPRGPLVDRFTQAVTPGGIGRMFFSLAAAHAKQTELSFQCLGSLQFGNMQLRDWKRDRDERLTLAPALANGANTYFYQLAEKLGAKQVQATSDLFALGKPTQLALSTQASHWLSPRKPVEVSPLSLALASIGQGDSVFTPIDITTITSAIGTGHYRDPRLTTSADQNQFALSDRGIDPIHLRVVQKGLSDTVNGPRATARRASVHGLEVAGVSGTAQTAERGVKSYNAWFTGYAPAKSPSHTVTILLQGADVSGGRSAAPLASKIFEGLLAP